MRHKKRHKRHSHKIRALLMPLVFFIASCLIVLLLIRFFSSEYLDDVYPGMYCSENLIRKSDFLFVVPLPNNISIAENQTWCEKILSLNKTIGMHGIYHFPNNPGEFAVSRDQEYIMRGMQEFRKCFGFYPSLFKVPQSQLLKENEMLLKEMNLTIVSEFDMLFHKNYHCVDPEQKSYLVKINEIMDQI